MAAEQAVFAGGCFWCLEAAFRRVPGVSEVVSGYAGGGAQAPSYAQVCTGKTAYVEAVCISYDPEAVSYARLLELFWQLHDPTSRDRQGADCGPQYRSVVFYCGAGQRAEAEASMRETAPRFWEQPIVTELRPLDAFHAAEPGHQRYYDRNAAQPYCQVVIAPKLTKLEQLLGG